MSKKGNVAQSGATWRCRVLAAAGVAGVLALSACATDNMSRAASPASSATSSTASAATSTPDNLTGPIGTTFSDSTTDDNGNPVKYEVTAKRVLDPATGSDSFETPDNGKRFVGVKFKIRGDSGYSHDDANNDAVILGSDGQTYTADFNSISAGTNFNSGDFSVTAGQTQTGWVTFQLPNGVRVASVQWQPGLGDSQPATWTVRG